MGSVESNTLDHRDENRALVHGNVLKLKFSFPFFFFLNKAFSVYSRTRCYVDRALFYLSYLGTINTSQFLFSVTKYMEKVT